MVPPGATGERGLSLVASGYVPAGLTNGRDPQPRPLRVATRGALVLYTDGLMEARDEKEEYSIGWDG